MLEQNTIKALIEAMLFTSDKPVTLRQMATRVRHVIKKTEPQVDILDANGETVVDVSFEMAVEQASAANDEQVEFAPTIESKDEDSSQIITNELPNDESNEVDSTDEDGDVMAQLLERQKELDDDVTLDDIKAHLFSIEEDLRRVDRGIELVQIAKGYQLRTKPEISNFLRDDKKVAPMRLSPSSLETLAIVAYEQPVPKHKIEDVRGVDCGGVLKTLLDREFIRIVGRSDEPGRPIVYGTTGKFLEVFGLNSLKDLPNPSEFQSLAEDDSAHVEVVSEDHAQAPDDGNEYIHATDFGDADAVYMSESERAILDELDQSLAGLKDVEKGIDIFQKKEEATETAVSDTSEIKNPQ